MRRLRIPALLLILSACTGGLAPEPGNELAATADPARSDDLDRHLAIEEIKQLKARYFRYLDTKNWMGMASLFTHDAQAVYNVEDDSGPGTPSDPVVGADQIAAFIQRAVDPLVTVHHGHMPEIELTSPTTARGIWAMEDILQSPEGSVDVVHGFGHYHETYERIDGEWRIHTLRLTRLRVDRR